MIKKCDCYHESKRYVYNPMTMEFRLTPYNYCSGTREQDACSCGGDRIKCDFYPEMREKAIRETKKIITNGDNIRSMNSEELAEFLMTNWFVSGVCKNCEGEYDRCGDSRFCESKILEWLLKEKGK